MPRVLFLHGEFPLRHSLCEEFVFVDSVSMFPMHRFLKRASCFITSEPLKVAMPKRNLPPFSDPLKTPSDHLQFESFVR